MMGVADLPIETLKALKIHPNAVKSKVKENMKPKEKKGNSETKIDDSTSSISTHSASSSKNNEEQPSVVAKPAGELQPSPIPDAKSEVSGITSTTFATGTSASTILEPPASPSTPSTTRGRASQELKSPDTYLSVPGSSSPPLRGTSPSSQMGDAVPALSDHGSDSDTTSSKSPSWRRHRRSHSHSRSSAGNTTPGGHRRSASATLAAYSPVDPLDTVYGTGKGLSKIIGAGLKSPLDFTLALSRGFHNVPRLYGEEVRQVDRVTGIQSGLRTAGKVSLSCLSPGRSQTLTRPRRG
jgi:hypothetical protein